MDAKISSGQPESVACMTGLHSWVTEISLSRILFFHHALINVFSRLYSFSFIVDSMTSPPINTDMPNKPNEMSRNQGGSLMDESSTTMTKKDPEKGLGTVMVSHHHQSTIQFTPTDTSNPRNWSPRKKSAIAIFALYASFVA